MDREETEGGRAERRVGNGGSGVDMTIWEGFGGASMIACAGVCACVRACVYVCLRRRMRTRA